MSTLNLYRDYPVLINKTREWSCQILNEAKEGITEWVVITYNPKNGKSTGKAKRYTDLSKAIRYTGRLIDNKLSKGYNYKTQDPRYRLMKSYRSSYYEGIPTELKYPLIAQPISDGISCLYDTKNGFVDEQGNSFDLPHIYIDTKDCIIWGWLTYKNAYIPQPSSILDVVDLNDLVFNIADVYDPSRPGLIYKDLSIPNNDRLSLLWDIFKPLMKNISDVKWVPIEICTDRTQLDLVGARYLGLDFNSLLIRSMSSIYTNEAFEVIKAISGPCIQIVGVGKDDNDVPIMICQEMNDEARCFSAFIRGLPNTIKQVDIQSLTKYLNVEATVKHYSYTLEGLPLFCVVDI